MQFGGFASATLKKNVGGRGRCWACTKVSRPRPPRFGLAPLISQFHSSVALSIFFVRSFVFVLKYSQEHKPVILHLLRHSAIMNAIIIVHTSLSLYIYGSISVGFVIITFLADWMCGIENMYLCNCIVCLMANSILEEEKNTLFTRLYWFSLSLSFFKENVNLVFFSPLWYLSKETLFCFWRAEYCSPTSN